MEICKAVLRVVIVISSWAEKILRIFWKWMRHSQIWEHQFLLYSCLATIKRKCCFCVHAEVSLKRYFKKKNGCSLTCAGSAISQNHRRTQWKPSKWKLIFPPISPHHHPAPFSLQEWTSSTTWLFPTRRCLRHQWALELHHPWITRSKWTWAPFQRWGDGREEL